MAIQEKQLGQLRPADTNAVSLYSPPVSTTGLIRTVIICNTSAVIAKFRIFQDDDGTTFDESTAIAWDVPLDPGSFLPLVLHLHMNNPAGNLAVRTNIANALTFTASGAEIT